MWHLQAKKRKKEESIFYNKQTSIIMSSFIIYLVVVATSLVVLIPTVAPMFGKIEIFFKNHYDYTYFMAFKTDIKSTIKSTQIVSKCTHTKLYIKLCF